MGARGPIPARSDQKRRRNAPTKPVERVAVAGAVVVPAAAKHWHATAADGGSKSFEAEVMLLTPFALAYAWWLAAWGQAHFLAGNLNETLLLLGCGLVTAVPLMLTISMLPFWPTTS